MNDALFVYGSLREGARHPMYEVLREHGTLAGPARVRGRLYVVDWYPGLVLDDAAGWVVGELWTSIASAAWPVLDFYEGCSAEDPAPHEYVRRSAQVDVAGVWKQAWVYDYARNVGALTMVDSGDWLERSSTKNPEG
ncbi:MAG: gamma-glutamylcyclotransferase [Nannocystaceae bacterium]|nr:gamma-glutamylcyclotransferase [bacterium]